MWEAMGKSPELHTGAILDHQNPNSPTSCTQVYEWAQPRSAKPDPADSRPGTALPEESKMLWHQICNTVVRVIICLFLGTTQSQEHFLGPENPALHRVTTLSSIPKGTEPWTEAGKSQCRRPCWTQASSSDCKSCFTVASSDLWLCASVCPWLVRSPRMPSEIG